MSEVPVNKSVWFICTAGFVCLAEAAALGRQ